MLFANTVAGPTFAIAKSATGVTVVVTGGVTLFVGVGSGVGEPTLAKFVSVPLAGAVTVTVRLVFCAAASVPKFHVTRPLLVTPLPLALTNVTLLGKVSVTITPLAGVGPRFVTESV